ncbi:MAG TPA: hypothetical protein P5205_13490 [Candidatus Paceibacterota bacterium]|nr:hypothetical protein [Candidatus Paceibacterota bacterium]
MRARAKNGSKPGPKGKGVFRVIAFTNPGGATAYRVTGWTLNGERIRQNYSTHGEAVARLQELEIQTANLQGAARPVITRLTPEQAAEAEVAYAQLEGRPLLVAIRFFLDNYRDPLKKCSVGDAFSAFVAEKKAANKRPLTIRNLETKCRALKADHGKKLVSDISEDLVRDLINQPGRGPVARDNYRRVLNGFFAWAQEKGFTPVNPVAKIDRIESDEAEPAVLSLDECTALMNAARAHKEGKLVPFVALALFAGLRPDQELKRISWSNIDPESETITVSGKVAKMRGRRTIEAVRLTRKDATGQEIKLPSNLFQWLSPHIARRTPIKGTNWRRDFDAIKRTAGFGPKTEDKTKPQLKPWVQDYLRHTAVSYHYALYEHEGKTAKWAGNSPDIVHRKYKGLVKPADVAKFWSIVPEAPANVVHLQKEKVA